MNHYHLVQLARQTFKSLVDYQTYNPNQINNSAYCIGYFPKTANEKLFMRNVLLNYFFNEANQPKLLPSEPTAFETKQLQYIKSKWATTDLEDYIKNIDSEVDDDADFDSKSINALDAVFTAADVPLVERITEVLPDLPVPEQKLPNIEVKLEPFNENKSRRGRKPTNRN